MSLGETPQGVTTREELRDYVEKVIAAYFKNIPVELGGNVTAETKWSRPLRTEMDGHKLRFEQDGPETLSIHLSNNWKTGSPVRVEEDDA